MGSPGKGQEVHGGKGQEVQGAGSPWPAWGWEMENQGRFQGHSGGEMDLEWFWSLSPQASSSHLVMGDGQEGSEDLSRGPKSGSTVRWLVLSPPL